ncbi:MAG: hypothetical protein KQH57_09650 [Actinomycetales bacterium]|nr:hypothetical protein [Actinomycetales bacterium]
MRERTAATDELTQWLEVMDPAALEGYRSVASIGGEPALGLRHLAAQLTDAPVVHHLIGDLTTPQLEVLALLMAMGDGADLDRLVALVGDTATDGEVLTASAASVVAALVSMALVWPVIGPDGPARVRRDESAHHVETDGRVRVSPAVPLLPERPAGLGAPVREWLARTPDGEVAEIARLWRATGRARRSPDHARSVVAEAIGDPRRVRQMVATAPADALAVLLSHVDRAVARTTSGAMADGLAALEGASSRGSSDELLRALSSCERIEAELWSRRRGLLFTRFAGYEVVRSVPSEVALALAPSGLACEIHLEPPTLDLAESDQPGSAARGRAALARMDCVVRTLLDVVESEPVVTLRSPVGAVPVRRLRALAGQVRAEVPTVRLALGLMAVLGQLEWTRSGRIVVAPGAAAWVGSGPVARRVDLLMAWDRSPAAFCAERTSDGARARGVATQDRAQVRAREVLLWQLARLAPGLRLLDPAQLVPYATWEMPRHVGPRAPRGMAVADALPVALREAMELGAVVDGALTPIGRALVRGGGGRGPLDEVVVGGGC